MKGSRRVTVRLPNDVWDILMGAVNEEPGIDKSAVVRQALKAHLGPDGTFKVALTLPEELWVWRKAAYLEKPAGLREDLREQLAEIVACADACRKCRGGNPGMLEDYQTLLGCLKKSHPRLFGQAPKVVYSATNCPSVLPVP